MKKILILHQPFPMGNYKLMPYIGNHLSNSKHEVFLLEQLNGKPINDEYIRFIKSQNFDTVYFEMLDKETFKLIENLEEVNRVLCYASKGIFNSFDDILSYGGILYDKVLTNSKVMIDKFNKKNIPCEHFEFYPAPLDESEILYESKYNFRYVYLGGGFQRLNKPEYNLERNIIYNNSLVQKYGSGWHNTVSYKGLLPPEDIGKLYNSSFYSLGTIEPSQREMGMINNRYSEIMKSKGVILGIPYKNIDYFGAEEFITFVDTPNLLGNKEIKIDKEKQYNFIVSKENDFFAKLKSLI